MFTKRSVSIESGAAIFAFLHLSVSVPLVRSDRAGRVEFPLANFTLERLKIEMAHHVILH